MADGGTWSAIAEREGGRLVYWAPVALGLGVWTALSWPGLAPWPAWTAIGVAALGVGLTRVGWRRVVAIAIGLAALGLAAAELRMARVAAPVWPPAEAERAQRFGLQQIEGRVLRLAPPRDGRARWVLDQVAIGGVDPEQTPRRIQATVAPASEGEPETAWLGARVRFSARLLPPPGPAEPGAFDFRRYAWFQQIGALAVGARDVERIAPAIGENWIGALGDALRRARAEIAARARAAAPGQEGAIVAALLVGDRSGLEEPTLEDLRDANLAHLLAISGLHMALVCVTVFATLRGILALAPGLGLRLDAKKLAAAAALIVGALYLALTGAAIPAQRAYVMAAAAFGAVLVDRPAITLRAVAMAATLILLWRPESLLSASFQLSFAATTAMVAVFEATRGFWISERRLARRGAMGWLRRLGAGAAALALASLTAGVATGPFAAFAFNRVSRYGLLANLAAVPAMGLWIMPFGVLALSLSPFGLDGWCYGAMALGVRYVLAVAAAVSSLPGAASAVKAGSEAALALIAFGGLWLCLWRSWGVRLLGLAPVALGAALWSLTPRPDLLVSRGGRLIGVLTEHGRALNSAGDGGYAGELWRRRDGRLDPPQAASFVDVAGGLGAALPQGWRLEWLETREIEGGELTARCQTRVVLIMPNARVYSDSYRERAPCVLLDRTALGRAGATSVRVIDGAAQLRRAADDDPRAPWARQDARSRDQ